MTQPLQSNKWGRFFLVLFLMFITLPFVTWFAGYIYFLIIKFNPYTATPLTAVKYWIHYPHARGTLGFSLGASSLVVWGCVIYASIPKGRELHGSARFSLLPEIKKSGLIGGKGIILGQIKYGFLNLKRHLLILKGQLGVILIASPRSGKGASFVNTNMLNWPDSVVMLDPRQESWRVTSGFRASHGQECYLFNPLADDGRTAKWNPLSYVSSNPSLRINDIQKLANMFFPDPDKGDSFWMASSRTMFLGVGLFVLETPSLPGTMGEVLRQVMHTSGGKTDEHWQSIIDGRSTKNPLSEECLRSLSIFTSTPEKTLDNIVKSFTSKLELWLNPIIDAATSGNSFDFRDLRKKRISIYFGVLPSDLGRLQVITSLFFQQFIDVNTREMPEDNPDLIYQVFGLLDEFTAMGRIPIIASAAGFLGGYNIRLGIVIQSFSQLVSTYGMEIAKTIAKCMGAQIYFAPRDNEEARAISEDLGYETVKSQSRSKGRGLNTLEPSKNTGSVSESDQRRALLLPQEVKAIGKDRQIVVIENHLPIFCHKIWYFKDRAFKARLMPAHIQSKVDISIRPKAINAAVENTIDLLNLSGQEVVTTWRQMVPEDVKDLKKMSLDDLAGNFDDIDIGDPMSEEEMKLAVDLFLGEFK